MQDIQDIFDRMHAPIKADITNATKALRQLATHFGEGGLQPSGWAEWDEFLEEMNKATGDGGWLHSAC